MTPWLLAAAALPALVCGCTCGARSGSSPDASASPTDASPGDASQAGAALLFDGVYKSVEQKRSPSRAPTFAYLRFQADGVGCAVTSSQPPTHVMSWFRCVENDQSVGTGRYELQGDRFTLSATAQFGQVDYAGRIVGDSLYVDVHSRVNDARGKETYVFLPQAHVHAHRPGPAGSAAPDGGGAPPSGSVARPPPRDPHQHDH